MLGGEGGAQFSRAAVLPLGSSVLAPAVCVTGVAGNLGSMWMLHVDSFMEASIYVCSEYLDENVTRRKYL